MGIERATAKTSNDSTAGSGYRFPSARRIKNLSQEIEQTW
jgi:hypothetical protein